MLPIIDTHQHLWDLSKFTLPWVSGAPAINRSYLQSDYAAATAGLNVVKAVYMEVDVAPEQQVAEAHYVIEQSQRDDTPTVAAVISGRPATDAFVPYITQFKGNPYIKGVRQVLHGPGTPAGYCLQPTFVKNIQLLGELGMSFDLCLRPGELGQAAALVAQCPETRFVVDHCGNADPNVVAAKTEPTVDPNVPFAHTRQQWLDDMQALANHPNVICKISGIVASATPGQWTAATLAPTVNHCLDVFGPDRVVFGGDWPVCTLVASYREWVTALLEIIASRSEQDQRKLLAENAERFYGLS
ncbi:MAG: amidohydrolase family protein [Caldilineaceae bacterium]|nr:amidohydrolase family protein [Caldilineaceae bacterium]